MKPDTTIIKKYPNRRLYDTNGSRYVNLEDIAALVQQGKDVQVVDASTGQDLTRVVLTQIITEHTKERPTGLPLELLRQIIMASDQVRQEFLMWYLKSAFDTYQKVQDTVQNRLTEVESAILSPVETMKRLLSGNALPRGSKDNDQEVAALRERVAELESLVRINARPTSSTKKRSTRPRSTRKTKK